MELKSWCSLAQHPCAAAWGLVLIFAAVIQGQPLPGRAVDYPVSPTEGANATDLDLVLADQANDELLNPPEGDETLIDGSQNADPAQPMNLLWLIWRGGPLMIVLGVFSVAVVAISIDRWMALRDSQLMPNSLLSSLGELTESKQGLDPSIAYLVCQDHPSATANVLRAMLLKVGRPQAEVDRVAAEAAQREASRLFANARWLALIAAIAPLVGLLGTVWGLIQAFYESTHIAGDQNRADLLSGGIYEALVTTLGGLVVAIPAATLAHYFEVRIERAFHRIDELLLNMAPHLERFEGQVHVEPTPAKSEPQVPGRSPPKSRSK
ncbi:MAG: MotA/TolQ/ExbB proton channel family protein [Planctomycetota bacterium]|nr:MotA/TolQ/ExbB proton channel family protein [Planctomycetota bacterium]MDA1179335.1 MotA/TolQ/ExbB proton channel family protein [Planctomycetota bacterium]